jgi:hypothetical protein
VAKTNQNFTMYRGESQIIFIEVDTSSGGSFDPAGSTFQWWVARSPYSIANDDGVLIKKSTTVGNIDLVTKGVNVTIDAADTVNMQPNIYYHELKILLPGGGVSVATVGNMILRPALDMSSSKLGAGAGHLTGTATVT